MGFDISGLIGVVLEVAEEFSNEAKAIAKKMDKKTASGDGISELQAALDRITRAGIRLEQIVETAIQEEAKVQDNMLQA